MKHLHFRFITASLALGLGFFNLIVVVWQAQVLSIPAYQGLTWLWFQAGLFLAGGSTLVCYGWHEVRTEMLHVRKKS